MLSTTPVSHRTETHRTETPRTSISAFVMVALIGAAALPPLATDMYLASLPEISTVFAVPVSISQLTLTLFLLVLGVGQLIAGPVSDAVGRRKPMLIGFAAFVVGSVLAALAPTMTVLLVARLLQGAGGAITVVVANSSVRDHASGAAATKLYAVLMSVVAIAPVLAPTIGGFIDSAFGWRAIFWTLAVLGSVLFLGSALRLRESLPARRRSSLALRSTFHGYAELVRNPAFVLPSAALVAMFGVLFSYIGGASYVYQNAYGLDASTFGLVFGASGLAMMLSTLLVNRLTARFSPMSLARAGTVGAVVGALGAAAAVAAGAPFWVLLVAITLAVLGLGLCEPTLMGAAMTATDERMGQAAALLGAAQFILGAIATLFAGPLAEASPLGWTFLLAGFAVLGLVLTLVARRHARR